MARDELSLDLGRFEGDSAAQHKALIDFLKGRRYLTGIYLYGATDASIVDWLRGKGEKPALAGVGCAAPSAPTLEEAAESSGEATKEPEDLENSVRLFTYQDLCDIERSIAAGQFKGELIDLARSHPNPVIAIYRASRFFSLPEEKNPILPGHGFMFIDSEKRYDALRTIVRLL